ncbi:MAG TPA: ABC transporter permease [Blastocatellia bacterium]|jgi:ABC-type antimicrobial peptide transport system permease subunit
MKTLLPDLRYSYRVLLKNPGFAVIAVLTLALGIGASTAIFSIVDAVLLRSLPYPEPDRIVELREVSEKGSLMPVAEPNFLDVRARSRGIEAIAQYAVGLVTVTGGSEPARARIIWASGDFFRVLGVQPMVGRTFAAEEGKPGGAAVVVLSYGLWRRLLSGKEDLTGATLKIDDRSFTVIGVMPMGFSFPQNAEAWIPRELTPPQISRSAHNWSVVARLRPGSTLEMARADVSAISRQLKEENGRDMDAADFAIIPLHEYIVGSVRNGLLILLVAVGFLLLIACTNVANLLLAQVTARGKEFAVRAALGASRARLAQQLITENLLLALIAGALGAMISYWGVGLLISLNERALPRANDVSVNTRALVFTLGLSLLIAVALGLVPLVRFSREDLQSALKESGRGQSAHPASHRLRALLVVSQMALTLVLLVSAGLLGKSFYRLLQVDPGFQPESAVVMDLSLPRIEVDEQQYRRFMQAYSRLLERGATQGAASESFEDDPREEQHRLFYQRLLDRLDQIPGVIAAGSINRVPMTGSAGSGTFLIENNPAKTGYAEYRLASRGCFAAMGIPLLRGRLFDQNDRINSPPVAVISQSLAEKYWPNEDPIGNRIQFGNMDGDLRLLQVVGVVGDVRDRGLDSNVSPTVYGNALQRPQSSSFSVIVRAQVDPATLIPAMRQAVEALNPELPANFRTLEQVFSSSLDARRFSLVTFSVFAVAALMLAVMGIYGVISYAVTQRTQEIGIRIALGAQGRDVLKLVVGQGLTLALIGISMGLVAAFGLTRLMASLLYGVSATDPAIFTAISLLLAGVALLASYIPARRATRVDPMVALRYE